MAGLASYAVLLRDSGQPNAEAIRLAFSTFQHLTALDCVRLAAHAHGILRRQLTADEARALQQALLAQGVAAAVVHEAELRFLPVSQRLHGLAFQPEALTIVDLAQHRRILPWATLVMIAVGAVPHLEVSVRTDLRSTPVPERQLILEFVTQSPAARYEIVAQHFPFALLPDCPAGPVGGKFVWLAGEFLRHSPHARLNRGAQDLRDGIQLIRGYSSRQALLDEMVWRLWPGHGRPTA